jgi:hypothetical protein
MNEYDQFKINQDPPEEKRVIVEYSFKSSNKTDLIDKNIFRVGYDFFRIDEKIKTRFIGMQQKQGVKELGGRTYARNFVLSSDTQIEKNQFFCTEKNKGVLGTGRLLTIQLQKEDPKIEYYLEFTFVDQHLWNEK